MSLADMAPGRLLNVHRYGFRHGGAEAVFLDHAGLFAGRGWACAEFCMAHPENPPSPWETYFPAALEAKAGIGGLLQVPRFVWSRDARRQMARLLDDFHPDIVHIHGLYQQLTPSVLGPIAERRIPIVFTLHDFKLLCPAYMLFAPKLGPCERCADGGFWHAVRHGCLHGSRAVSAVYALDAYVHRWRRSFDVVDAFVMPSRSILEIHAKHGFPAEKLHHVPNFFETTTDASADPAMIAKARDRYGRYIAYFGRLSAEKGLAHLIDACATANLPLVLIGDGPERASLERQALGSPSAVHFTGYQSHDALWALVEGALGVALPSIWHENAPKSVLEAMARRKPVVASRIGGLPEQIEDGVTGLLAEPADPTALAEALVRLASLEPEALARMGDQARERALTQFTTDRYFESMAALYYTLSGSNCMG
ncbi:MAG: glycosyltransferase family 4 protein [Pirellulaceae bacterium]